jgi:hypothetical protein
MTLKAGRSVWLVALIDLGWTLVYFGFVFIVIFFGLLPASTARTLCFLNLLLPVLAVFGIIATQSDLITVRLLLIGAVFLIFLNVLELGIRLLLPIGLNVVLILLIAFTFVFMALNGLMAFFAYKLLFVAGNARQPYLETFETPMGEQQQDIMIDQTTGRAAKRSAWQVAGKSE